LALFQYGRVFFEYNTEAKDDTKKVVKTLLGSTQRGVSECHERCVKISDGNRNILDSLKIPTSFSRADDVSFHLNLKAIGLERRFKKKCTQDACLYSFL